jgi:hypothetical protein
MTGGVVDVLVGDMDAGGAEEFPQAKMKSARHTTSQRAAFEGRMDSQGSIAMPVRSIHLSVMRWIPAFAGMTRVGV